MKKGKKPNVPKAEAGRPSVPGPDVVSSPPSRSRPTPVPKSVWARLAIVLAGIILGQIIIYGPSLAGQKILLPLDLLAFPNVYLPDTPENQKIKFHNIVLADLVTEFEPMRQFAGEEIRAGRFPMWAPFQYTGSPVIWPKFSPFLLLGCLTASPVILAWAQLAAALVAGLGAYAFCRKALPVGFWPAAIVAWCYPLTGFFVFWQGYPTCFSAYWLPWLLLAVNKTVRERSPLAIAALGVVTGLVLVSGHIDVAGQVLLASGLYGIWCLVDVHGRAWWQQQSRKAALLLAVGWALGFMLAAPHLLPLLEYAKTGSRYQERSKGAEERPPIGMTALPQIVLPDMYGSSHTGSIRIVGGNQTESSAAGYSGIFAALLLAPLAWRSRAHRSSTWFWCLMILFGLSWSIRIPGLVQLLRLPGLNMMSHNRLVFVSSFGILALAAVGLEVLERNESQRRWWFWLPAAVLSGLGLWCLHHSSALPEPLATQVEAVIRSGRPVGTILDVDGVHAAQAWFTSMYGVSAILCALGVAGWFLVWFRPKWNIVPLMGVVLLCDLLWFAHDRSAQADPALFYPRLPVLEQVAKAGPGRVIGSDCLPSTVTVTCGLRDVRGYDSIDPARMVELLSPAGNPDAHKTVYAQTQWYSPLTDLSSPDRVKLSPILDMLNVRHVVFRGTPPAGIKPAFQGVDYWAQTNVAVLPRPFIPARVETVTNSVERLAKLASPQFDPRAVAYVESPVNLPESCRGSAMLKDETPTKISIDIVMETPGLIVLADLWDVGWRAYLNGQSVPILRANHAVRGVVVPTGKATLEFRYEPASFARGVRLATLSMLMMLGGLGFTFWRQRRTTAPASAVDSNAHTPKG